MNDNASKNTASVLLDASIPPAILGCLRPDGLQATSFGQKYVEVLRHVVKISELTGLSIRVATGAPGEPGFTFRAERTDYGTVAVMHITGSDFAKSVRRWASRFAWRCAGAPKKAKMSKDEEALARSRRLVTERDEPVRSGGVTEF